MENMNSFLVAALGSVATAIMAYVMYRGYRDGKAKKGLKLFFSIQNNKLQPDAYAALHNIMTEVIENVKQMKRVESAFWYNQSLQSHSIVHTRDIDISQYMDEIDRCDCFIAIVSDKIHSSIYFEAGYALAKGKSCYFFARRNSDEDPLPSIMNGVANVHKRAKRIEYDSNEALVKKIRELLPNL